MHDAHDLTEARFHRDLDDFAASPQGGRTDAPSVGRHVGAAAPPAGVLEAARAKLKAAQREEGEALVSASEAVRASGARSVETARAMRSVEAAHARSSTASCEVRALRTQADASRDEPSSAVVETQARLAKAYSALDRLAHARTSEKYMACYFLVEALELQLRRLLNEAPPLRP